MILGIKGCFPVSSFLLLLSDFHSCYKLFGLLFAWSRFKFCPALFLHFFSFTDVNAFLAFVFICCTLLTLLALFSSALSTHFLLNDFLLSFLFKSESGHRLLLFVPHSLLQNGPFALSQDLFLLGSLHISLQCLNSVLELAHVLPALLNVRFLLKHDRAVKLCLIIHESRSVHIGQISIALVHPVIVISLNLESPIVAVIHWLVEHVMQVADRVGRFFLSGTTALTFNDHAKFFACRSRGRWSSQRGLGLD